MKNAHKWACWPILLAALLLAVGGTAGRAEGLTIQSFEGTGQIVFGAVTGATN